MPQVINAKTTCGPNAIGYGTLDFESFNAVTLSSNQTTGTVAQIIVFPVAIKIIALSVVMTTVNGSAPVAVNLCSGTGPQGGLGPTDPLLLGPAQGNPQGGYPPLASQMMGNGNIYFAADQQLNGASAPVVNTPYTLYPTNDMWDAIWPANSLVTLRLSAGAGAASGVLQATIMLVPVDIHPYLPNAGNPFAPTAAIL